MSFARKMFRKDFLKSRKAEIKRSKEIRKSQGYPVSKDEEVIEKCYPFRMYP